MIMNSVRENFRIFLCVLLIAGTGVGLSGAEISPRADSLVASGNKFYLDRDYSKAIECYSRVLDMGYSAAPLYFNLGNAYYKQNNIPKAILYYEKARLLSPGDEDIKMNLSIANSRILDKIENIPEFFLRRWVAHLVGIFAPDRWAFLGIVLFALSLGAFFMYMFANRDKLKKTGFSTGVVLVTLSLTCLIMMHIRKQHIQQSHGAIIMSPVVNVKSSPDQQGTSVFVLHEGTRVTLLDSVQQWQEIKIPDGNKGWVQSTDLAGI
jgi:hypothetical protein